MAKAKKEAALTPEERLQAALVPDWEWPYKLPENWCWANHNALIDISGGSQPDKSFFLMHPADGYVQLYQTRDYGEHPIPVYIPSKYATKLTKEGDILLARYGGSLGKVFRAHDGAYNVALAKVINLFPQLVDDEYLYHYYLSSFYQDFCVKAGSGRSAQAGFNRSDLSELPFPLPPLAEQQRIVNRIESLFAKLDEAKEKAQAVVDSYETRKAAILHKAFTGELTANWREENNIKFKKWNQTILSQIVSGFKYGTSEKSDYSNCGMPVFRIPNIGDEGIDFSDMKYLPHNNIDVENQVHQGDVLIIRSNGSRDLVGKCAIVPALSQPHAYGSFLIRIKPSCVVKSEFLVAYLNSSIARSQMFKKAKSSAGINNINSKELGAIAISVPPIEEQIEIVRVLDDLFVKEQQAKEAAEAVLDQIDLIKKSILARAFRGELGTNDPTDEPAVELLKKVLDIPSESKPSKKRLQIPQGISAKINSSLEREIVKAILRKESHTISLWELGFISKNTLGILESIQSLERKNVIVTVSVDTYKIKD